MSDNRESPGYLACESKYVFEILMISAGMMGAYTFILRGGVFCNAQTANFVMMAVDFGQGEWRKGIYFLIPMTAYFMGAVLSEFLPTEVRKIRLFRWDTCLIAFEMAVLLAAGFIPLTVPNQVVQVMINFICSMQYNTFRQAESIPMATTFCTNHLRQTGICMVRFLAKGDQAALGRGLRHVGMLGCFVVGGILESVCCTFAHEKAIWLALIPMGIDVFLLARADLGREHGLLDRVPSGH